jgi:hypothetical protein
MFDELPVRICPACEQDVDRQRPHDEGTCYLCLQPVSEDVRIRRAERERRALEAEAVDIDEAILRAEADLASARARLERASELRTALAAELHDVRVTALAPFVARLEDVSTEIGKVTQQLAAIPALADIIARRTRADQAVGAAATEVDRLRALAEEDARVASHAVAACAALAERMNGFLGEFSSRGWVAGHVTVSAEDLEFYVGTRPWDQALGAEARVLFFLAYSYALLHLELDLPGSANAPGLVILDNPFQQGVDPAVVSDAVDLIGAAATQLGVQAIVTQSRNPSELSAPHYVIRMPHEYAN